MVSTNATPTSAACLVQGSTLPSTHLRVTSTCGELVEGLDAVNTETDLAIRVEGENIQWVWTSQLHQRMSPFQVVAVVSGDPRQTSGAVLCH